MLGMEKVKGEIQGRYYPSICNYKAMGFSCEGVFRNEIARFDGRGRTMSSFSACFVMSGKRCSQGPNLMADETLRAEVGLQAARQLLASVLEVEAANIADDAAIGQLAGGEVSVTGF